MAKKLYVGNLAFQTTSQDLQALFAQAGTVESASAIEDRDTGHRCRRLHAESRIAGYSSGHDGEGSGGKNAGHHTSPKRKRGIAL